MMKPTAYLVVTPPEARSFSFPLEQPQVSIGRDLTADLTIPDTLLSRVHLRLLLVDGVWHVEDAGSRNGTFIGGKRVGNGARVKLENAADITAGLSAMRFVLGEREAEAPPVRRVVKPTEDFFSVAELLDESGDASTDLARLMIRVAEELLPEHEPKRVLAAATAIAAAQPGCRAAAIYSGASLLAGSAEVSAPTPTRVTPGGAQLSHEAGHRELFVTLDAPKNAVLVVRLDERVEPKAAKVLVALGTLTSSAYASAVSHSELRRDNHRLVEQFRAGMSYDVDHPALLEGRSKLAEQLRSDVERLAGEDAPLRIVGEAGLGKERIARAIHARSRRSAEPFVVVDAQKADLDAYSGFEGVLFVEHADAAARATLRSTPRARVMFAEVTDSGEAERALLLTPLRARKDDIALIAQKLCRELSAHHRVERTLSASALRWLSEQPLGDNTRELSRCIERAMLTSRDAALTDLDLAEGVHEGEASTLPDALAAYEKEYVLRVLQSQHGHRIRTAGILGISRQALGRKLRAYGLIAADDED